MQNTSNFYLLQCSDFNAVNPLNYYGLVVGGAIDTFNTHVYITEGGTLEEIWNLIIVSLFLIKNELVYLILPWLKTYFSYLVKASPIILQPPSWK